MSDYYTKPPPKRSKGPGRLALVMAVVLGLIILGYGGYWLYMKDRLNTLVDDWMAGQRAAGTELSYSARELSGFPFRYDLDLEDVVYAPAGGPSWQAERLKLRMQPWNWYEALAIAPGAHVLEADGRTYRTALGDDSVLSLGWDNEALRRASLNIGQAPVSVDGAALVELTGAEFHWRPEPGSDRHVQLAAAWQRIILEPALVRLLEMGDVAEQFGTELGESTLLATLTEAEPSLVRGDVAAWAAGEGELRIAQLKLAYGPLQLGAKGGVGFDAAGRANGDINLRLEEIDALREAVLPLLPAGRAMRMQATMAFGALAGAMEDGQFLTVPVRDGQITVLGQSLARLPALPVG